MAYIIADPASGYSPVREVTKLDGRIEYRYARGTNCVEHVNRPLEVTLPSSCGQAFALDTDQGYRHHRQTGHGEPGLRRSRSYRSVPSVQGVHAVLAQSL
jgi:hypothetical protein